MPIRLTYPVKSHATEDLVALYEEFKTTCPTVFEQWYQVEAKGKIESPDELKEVADAIREFLKARVEWDSDAALTGAFADFRRLINKDMFGSNH